MRGNKCSNYPCFPSYVEVVRKRSRILATSVQRICLCQIALHQVVGLLLMCIVHTTYKGQCHQSFSQLDIQI